MDRRDVLTAMALLATAPAIAATPKTGGTVRLLIGTFGHEGGKGTYIVEAPANRAFGAVAEYPSIDSASFGAYDPANRRIYVTERNANRIAAYSADGTNLKPLGAPVSSMAVNPCYLSLSPGRTHLAVANYASDVVAIYGLDKATGEITGEPQVLRSQGLRENGHAHWVQWSPDGKGVYVVDLGHEEVRLYPWDRAKGLAGAPETAFSVAKGSGPRHLAWSSKGSYGFLLTEKSGELISLRREADGRLSEVMRVPLKSEGYSGEYAAAHIATNAKGDRVYISERGPNTIRVYAVAADGVLSHLQTIASGGNWPRFFTLLEPQKRLLVANQRDGVIANFDVQADGTLKTTDIRFTTPAPVYIQAI